MSKKQRNKWCQQSAMIHLMSLDISISKSLADTPSIPKCFVTHYTVQVVYIHNVFQEHVLWLVKKSAGIQYASYNDWPYIFMFITGFFVEHMNKFYPSAIVAVLYYVANCKGFRNADVQGNEMDHSTLLTQLVSLLFCTFLNPLQIYRKFFIH